MSNNAAVVSCREDAADEFGFWGGGNYPPPPPPPSPNLNLVWGLVEGGGYYLPKPFPPLETGVGGSMRAAAFGGETKKNAGTGICCWEFSENLGACKTDAWKLIPTPTAVPTRYIPMVNPDVEAGPTLTKTTNEENGRRLSTSRRRWSMSSERRWAARVAW